MYMTEIDKLLSHLGSWVVEHRRRINGWVILVITLCVTGFIPTKNAGFFCDDVTIKYKFRGDSISLLLLLVISTLAPVVTFFLVETFHAYRGESGGGAKAVGRRSWRWFRDYGSGQLVSVCVNELMKTIMSEPRPHFLDSCRPDFSRINCSQGYISDFDCTNANIPLFMIRDSMRSFPSGHAAMCTFTMVFMTMYIHRRITHRVRRVSHFLKTWLQLVCVIWAIVCSLSRVIDHRHHWWDVLAGCIQGAAVAAFTVVYVSNMFRPFPRPISPQQRSRADDPRSGSVDRSQTMFPQHGRSFRRLLSSLSSYESDTIPEGREMNDFRPS